MTKQEFLQFRVDSIAESLGLTTSRNDAIDKGHKKYLKADYYSYGGGYILVYVNVDSGGESHFYKNSRVKYQEFITYLDGILDGFYKIRELNEFHDKYLKIK